MGLARFASIGTALCAAAAAVSSAVYAQDLPVIRIQGVSGSISSLPLLILDHENLDEKHGFQAEIDLMGPQIWRLLRRAVEGKGAKEGDASYRREVTLEV